MQSIINHYDTDDHMLQRVHVEEHMDDRLGGPNSVGRKFLSYCKNENVNPLDSIPDVDIKFKVYRISDFDGKRGTFYVEFVLMLDWLDPSLELCENNNPDFHEHYWPKPELLNLSPDSPDLPDFESIVPKYKKDEKNCNGFGIHRASLTYKFRAILYSRLDFRNYPFDSQALELSIKLSSIRIPGAKQGKRPKACHPKRWRSNDGGHELIPECDNLPEFSLIRLASMTYSSKYGPYPVNNELIEYNNDVIKDKLYQDQFTLQIIISRDSVSVLWNLVFSLLVIDVMVFTAHGIAISELGDRLGINLTLLLTAMAFKWVLADALPSTPYLTTMECYVISTFAILFFQGISFWFISDAFNYRCGVEEFSDKRDYRDWITGKKQAMNSTSTATMDISCETIHILDRILLMFEVLCFLTKNIWMGYQIKINGQIAVSKKTKFEDLSKLKEYSMIKKLTHIGGENDVKHKQLLRRRSKQYATKGEGKETRSSSKVFVGRAKVGAEINALPQSPLLSPPPPPPQRVDEAGVKE
jgi:hypothetical protein